MKINRASLPGPVLSSALALMVSACAAPTVVPQAPTPAPRPAPAPPPPVPAAAAPKDWRDAPQTAGDWTYQPGIARFGSPQGTLFAMACNRNAGTISLLRTGTSSVALPMTVATTSETRALSAEPAPQGQPQLVTTLPVRDALLDAMAFSRGRFSVEVNGLPTLYLPAWAEVGRVLEDCRR